MIEFFDTCVIVLRICIRIWREVRKVSFEVYRMRKVIGRCLPLHEHNIETMHPRAGKDEKEAYKCLNHAGYALTPSGRQ
jgi:hypothetical protein